MNPFIAFAQNLASDVEQATAYLTELKNQRKALLVTFARYNDKTNAEAFADASAERGMIQTALGKVNLLIDRLKTEFETGLESASGRLSELPIIHELKMLLGGGQVIATHTALDVAPENAEEEVEELHDAANPPPPTGTGKAPKSRRKTVGTPQ